MKFKLTTTLALLRQHNACESGYHTLLRSLGPKWPQDKTINLLQILKSNGAQDTLWTLRATREDSTLARVAIVASFAKSVLKDYTKFAPSDTRIADCIKTCFSFVKGKVTIAKLHDEVWTAFAAESTCSAYSPAWSAARVTTLAVGSARSANLAKSAAHLGSATGQKQARIISKWLA